MKIFNSKQDKLIRRKLRSEMAEPEYLLWSHIRSCQLGVKFRRQVSIGIYIADFYCPVLKLVIEVDGDSHFNKAGRQLDERRDRFMTNLGIRILRFTNNEIRNEIDGVLQRIVEAIDQNPL